MGSLESKLPFQGKQLYGIYVLVVLLAGGAGLFLIPSTWGLFFFFLVIMLAAGLAAGYKIQDASRTALVYQSALKKLNQDLKKQEEDQGTELVRMNKSLALEIRAHTEAEGQLRESEEKYKNLVNSLPDGIFIVQDKKIVLFNPGLERLTGLSAGQLSAACPHQLFPQSYPGKKSKGDTISDFIIGPDQQITYVEKQSVKIVYNGLPACLFVVRDTTEQIKTRQERKRLQKELEKAQKMEAIGLLAGGVAHDLNNVLSGIVSTPDLVLMDLPKDSPLIEPILIMKDSGKRAAIIVDELLTLARGAAKVLEPVRLNDVIEDYLGSPEFDRVARFHAGVTLIKKLAPSLPPLNASGLHMRKIIMNLTSNAMEAIENKGQVILETSLVQFNQKSLKGYERIKDGPYVSFSIQDTGPGISKLDLDHIFEPFYTKKVLGRSGTGLGLSIVWNAVHDHKGYIRVTSEKEKTVFQVFFPVTDVLYEGTEPDRIYTLSDYSGHNETVLVVDDVASQRKITANMLKRLGYRIERVGSGEEAIAFVRKNKVDLAILDMIMDPGISGLETFQALRAIDPGIAAVITSGYSKTNDVEKAQALGAGAFIKKPYSLEQLGLGIKEELQKRRS